MIYFDMYDEVNRDPSWVKTMLVVRNYYNHPEEADRLWEHVKSEYSLFDFQTLIPIPMDGTTSDSLKSSLMRNNWRCASNALYPQYMDNGHKYGIAFATDGMYSLSLMQTLAKQFPTLELFLVTMPKRLSDRYGIVIAELKGDNIRRFDIPSKTFTLYPLYKVLWGNEYSDPMAYDIDKSAIAFLDDPSEQNYRFQMRCGLYYAEHIRNLWDVPFINQVVLPNTNFSPGNPTTLLYDQQ